MNLAAKLLILVLCISALGAGASRPAPRSGDQGSFMIAIKDFEFTPRNLTIPAGSKVTWINKDEEPHKIVEVNNAFTSQPLDTDGNFTYQFDTPGTYQYFCALHPRMTGKIIVQN